MDWLILIFGAWLAATISGAAGFGGALLLLPVLAYTIGAKDAVPVLTLAQLLGNLSRGAFGFREIHWRPVLWFSLGAIPLSALGARLFIGLPSSWVMRLIGIFLVGIVIFRHTPMGKRPFNARWLLPAGALVGFLSATVGSAGPLGAAFFLGLHLPSTAYVASEAVTASLMHVTKSIIYGRYALLTTANIMLGLAMGGAMVFGSWTGRKLIQRMPGHWFETLIETLLVISALSLIMMA